MFIHLHLPLEIYRYLRVIQLKSSSKLACNANRPWHDEAGTIKIDRDIRDEAGRAHIWVLSYLFQHSSNTNKNQNFVVAIPDLQTPALPNFWNICFADCHSWRLAQDFQHCLCDCQVRQQEGVPWGISCQLLYQQCLFEKNIRYDIWIYDILCVSILNTNLSNNCSVFSWTCGCCKVSLGESQCAFRNCQKAITSPHMTLASLIIWGNTTVQCKPCSVQFNACSFEAMKTPNSNSCNERKMS